MTNMIAIYMLSGTVLSAFIAATKNRSVILWAVFGILAGPIAVAIVMWLPSREPRKSSVHPHSAVRSMADEIDALDDQRQRGMISDAEFAQGKVQILAWPVISAIPPELSPQRAVTDGRRTWVSYQPATCAAFADLAARHSLEIRWRNDLPFEVAATYPVQPGLTIEFTLTLDKATIHCWGNGWSLNSFEVYRPDTGIPTVLDRALDALIDGTGFVVTRTAYGASEPFWTALQTCANGKWRTMTYRRCLPWPPIWRRRVIQNRSRNSTDASP